MKSTHIIEKKNDNPLFYDYSTFVTHVISKLLLSYDKY